MASGGGASRTPTPRQLARLLAERSSLDRRGCLTVRRREGEAALPLLAALPALLGGGGFRREAAAGFWRYGVSRRTAQQRLLALAAPVASARVRRGLLARLARRLEQPLPPLAAAEGLRRRRRRALQRWLARGGRLWGWGRFRLALPPEPRGRRRRRRDWQWLAGLIDGDGSHWHRPPPPEGPQKRSSGLTIAGHRRELGPLRRARRLAGHGSLYREPPEKGNGAVYSLSHSRPLRRLLRRCGPYLQNPERRAQAAATAALWG